MIQTPASQTLPTRPKRVITEARKLQNREAQRAYRQRQKERVQKVRTVAQEKGATARYQPLQPYPTPQPIERDVPSAEALEWVTRAYRPRQPTAVETPISSIADTDYSVLTPSSGPLQTAQSISAASATTDPLLDLLFPAPATSSNINVDDLLVGSSDPKFFPTPPEEADIESPYQLSIPSTSDPASAYTYTTAETNNNNQDSRLAFRPTASRSTLLLADPQKNYLQTPKTNLISACLHNASLIGISLEEFFSYNCMSLCSPFYRQTNSSTDPQALLVDVTASVPFAPAHLRPTLPQILIPHHPLFDLVPIPRLRSRAIILSASVPHLVDMFELKADIVEGGLLCLGSRNDVALKPDGSGSGQPWEGGSWEIAPWFLSKWKLLLDRNSSGDVWG
ncbi:hypothetical protein HK57_00665 [Aspergillus ustus]|uniref:BZIP domain-containing protein n=1 Tax=Aspergillus ustus TaxID=40382 RepID=A0A0C1E1Y0_ASPUT|nr:hypothetical protein HK57_00665 [Aspergillus ustus]